MKITKIIVGFHIAITTIIFLCAVGTCVVFSLPKNIDLKDEPIQEKVEFTSQVEFGQAQKISFEQEPLPLETLVATKPQTEPLKTTYSPGNKEWITPTKEDTKEWKMEQWRIAVLKWAKPHLAVWYCCSCKEGFGENFRFIRTEGDHHIFKCKCKCDYDHIIKLEHE